LNEGFIADAKEGVILKLKVSPGSKRSLLEMRGDWLVAHVKSQREKGRANEELIQMLSQVLGVPKNRLTLLAGVTSKVKRVLISNVSREIVEDAIHRIGEETKPA